MKKLFLGGLVVVAGIALLTSCSLTKINSDLSVEDAKVKAEAFINEKLMAPGTSATITQITEENGLYKVSVDLGSGQVVDSFMTKDGKKFFPQFVDMEPVEEETATDGTSTETDATSATNDSGETPVAVAGITTFKDSGETPVAVAGITTFKDSGDPVCQEDGLPVVYLFSTTWCQHCEWVKDTFDSTVKEYVDAGKIKAYHWEVDINDDTLTSAVETAVPAEHTAVYNKFNPGGSIPTFVFGCKYSRVGNGYESQNDLVSEEAEFRAVINEISK